MIPIRDTINSKNYPVVNNSLIALCIFFFIIEIGQGAHLNNFLMNYGLVPLKYTPEYLAYHFSLRSFFPFVSFMFLHGGLWHLISNMLFLYVFGDNVEDRLGHTRYLMFYLACGITSGLSHMLFNLTSTVPIIGASGAIAGVMGAYIILHPRAKVLTLIPIIIIPYFTELPAFIFLGFWFAMQLINVFSSSAGSSGIAWWAHIGGFIFGIVFLKLFLLLPESKMSGRVRKITVKKKTPRLQVIHPIGPAIDDPHLYGTIVISPFEAIAGTSKLVNIMWGFHKRPYRVIVRPGIEEGQVLRLKGLGKHISAEQRGDLMLKVVIQ